MAANTSILIKRSVANSQPVLLAAGELAYSYLSNTIFIGSPSGTGVINIGGYHYTSQIDNATDAATGSTLVRRDASGNASFNYISANIIGTIEGNANSATKLQTARDFSINGDDVDSSTVSFDGTGNVVLQGNLKTTGVAAGTYGGQTEIPVFTVDSKGRLTSAANVSVATTLAFAADTGTANLSLLTDTLTIAGRSGLSTIAVDANNTVLIDVDDTVVRSNTAIQYQLIDGDVEISGNLIVLGNTTTINVSSLSVEDSLIALARNNTTDIVDIGFYGHYNDGTNRHAGVYRHAGDKQFYVFDNYDQEPAANTINPADASFRLATLHANLTANTGNIATLYVANRIYGDTSNNTLILAPSTNYGPGVNDQYIILDPTVPNHIHVRAGGTIDASSAELYLGGEETNVNVSDSAKQVYIRANNAHVWTFRDDGILELAGKIIAAQGAGTTGGYSFSGTEGGYDSGMFSNADGNVHFYADNTDVAYFTPNKFEISKQTYLTGLSQGATSNLVYFNATTGELSYASDNALTPSSIANGIYFLSISGTDGLLSSNGAGFQLQNGAIIKDTVGDAIAFGQNAGTLSQGGQAVAIGDSAGYNTQGTYGVAIGYGAGNVNQSVAAIAIGLNAGLSSQGYNGVAIGNSAGSGQGTDAIALGYSAGSAAGGYSVAIGHLAGAANTTAIGTDAIVIGRKAGFERAAANSIILNASGNDLSSLTSGLFINPVRYTATQDATYDGLMFYNSSTKEVRYSYALDGGTF
jgi:hypothetical protein